MNSGLSKHAQRVATAVHDALLQDMEEQGIETFMYANITYQALLAVLVHPLSVIKESCSHLSTDECRSLAKEALGEAQKTILEVMKVK